MLEAVIMIDTIACVSLAVTALLIVKEVRVHLKYIRKKENKNVI